MAGEVDAGEVRSLLLAMAGNDVYAFGQAFQKVERMGAAAFQPLLSLLSDPQPTVASRAERTLANFGEASLLFLEEALGRGEPALRRGIVKVLKAISEKKDSAASILIKAATDQDAGIREDAIQALIGMEDRAVLALAKACIGENAERQKAAETVLSRMRSRHAVLGLRQAIAGKRLASDEACRVLEKIPFADPDLQRAAIAGITTMHAQGSAARQAKAKI